MAEQLVDKFNRVVDYVRISVTDRCDFRCVYCMAEDMVFAPRSEILSLEEITLIAQAFVELGVSNIRLTGGEPLVRKGITQLVENIAALPGLKQLNMTSNGSQLPHLATPLKQAGLSRLNISLDSLKPDRFKQLTRTGDLQTVLDGIMQAKSAGFTDIKINCVVLKGRNDDEILDLIAFIRQHQLGISFIEEMPLGHIDEHDRALTFMSSADIRDIITQQYELESCDEHTGGPSRYWQFADGHTSRIGFISPHSHNFCGSCNRVRVTAQGRLLLCLGNEHSIDLKSVVRKYPGELEPVKQAIREAMDLKPERHHFELGEEVQILRFMNSTGG
ncbi:GTP 3',8-cyclase MoaA [Bermanella sp. WJH001]|uniref:GTP 3',8-cyclase MoaA n=1 Tax=Bermanella sp. WJH001 TaxID=3048005 RepID=UPI0024BDD0B7|nr:GTP 3',8-cyclase MoaA [Bermanella sp. WJH001]MDJ1539883.1 GTP 3',8-cyclase MoaA [Bermanella sp. WJH001]